MPPILIGSIIVALAILAVTTMSKKTKAPSNAETIPPDEKNLNLENAYQKKWLLSNNEKDAFHKLKVIADTRKYHIFTKVRLLDLIEPIHSHPKYKTLFYKIQAKHVDFVLCDEKLVARCIIELDDNSHKRSDRQERDTFVTTILEKVGYKVIHAEAITPEIIEPYL